MATSDDHRDVAGAGIQDDRSEAAAPGVLRFLTCGSVDDGKSTLIGRLLFDAELVPDDQLAALPAAAATGRGSAPDLALLLDGLQSEREQGITIDVAYRYFATPRRRFVVADTPGHEQYTRNMASGASVCDLAVVLVDATKGLVCQTRRHMSIVSLLGIRHVVLAVNKMDLVGYGEACHAAIAGEFGRFAARLGIVETACIPMCAREGGNVVRKSAAMPWYQGPPLLEHLERVDVRARTGAAPFRMPIQWVNRANAEFRGLAGLVESGSVRRGERIVVLPSGRSGTVGDVLDARGSIETAETGRSITVVLAEDVDAARGDVLAAAHSPPEVADQVAADIVWLGEEPMLPGRTYLVRCGTASVGASISRLRYKLNVETLDEMAATSLEQYEIGRCHVAFARPLVFEPYQASRALGSFIVIDKVSAATVGAGMIRFGLRRATNVSHQALAVNRAARETLVRQKARCLWFTGLSGAGKSTLANLLEKRLHEAGRLTYVLDGDNVRQGLNRDLGFTDADRVENVRRVAEVARLMVDAGLIVLVSLISPFASERQLARDLFAPGTFAEIFVDTPLEVCEARDSKGLYRKARAGLIPNFTGIGSVYERPQAPELRLDGASGKPEELVGETMRFLDIG